MIDPYAEIDYYVDYFDNNVETFSIPYRHTDLEVTSVSEIQTLDTKIDQSVLDVAVGEAMQIYNSRPYQLFDFVEPSFHVPLNQHGRIRKNFFQAGQPLGESLLELNSWIYNAFEYRSGETDISTPISDVVEQRRGVCQDFAHLMLAILRKQGIPARYVSGYIEAVDPEAEGSELVGAAASHAWVEVYLPGGYWWGLDPTNDQVSGERHVEVAVGRDYSDVAPMRGTYKGATDQELKVAVEMKRINLNQNHATTH